MTYPDHIYRMIDWHTSEQTGSKYWISRSLNGWDNETLYKWFLEGIAPNNYIELESDLRTRPVEDFIPSGTARSEIAGYFESGGTTGPPKRVILGEEWAETLIEWSCTKMNSWGHSPGRNWLVSVPTGPHVVGELAIRAARKEGAQAFRIDIDPRWAKNAALYGGNSAGYVDHLAEQVKSVTMSQEIGCLVTTPPILQSLVRDSELVNHINENKITIRWGGIPFSADSVSYMKDVIFPQLPFLGVLGNTMTLGFGIEDPINSDRHQNKQQFEFCSPFTRLSVCDKDNSKFLEFGEGKLAYAHASKTHLYPPMPDRDYGTLTREGLASLNYVGTSKKEKENGVY